MWYCRRNRGIRKRCDSSFWSNSTFYLPGCNSGYYGGGGGGGAYGPNPAGATPIAPGGIGGGGSGGGNRSYGGACVQAGSGLTNSGSGGGGGGQDIGTPGSVQSPGGGGGPGIVVIKQEAAGSYSIAPGVWDMNTVYDNVKNGTWTN